MGPCRIIFFCETRALRGIKQHFPACLTTMCRKPLLQTPPPYKGLFWSLLWALFSKKISEHEFQLNVNTPNIKTNLYFQWPTNVSLPAPIRIHRNYIMSEYGHKVNMNLPLPLFLARSSERLGTQKEESEHAETLGQRE